MSQANANAIEQVKAELHGKLEPLIVYLNEQHEVGASTFFTDMLVRLMGVETEEGLLELFLQLSTTAFQGFLFDETSWQMTDEMLQYAEQVAQTFTADTGSAH